METHLTLLPLVTGAEVAFWMLAPVMVLGALGMILARKPVHSALCLAAVMISLAVQYAAQDAPFLFAVQIIVYTGAILMLFLFVLMLVGRRLGRLAGRRRSRGSGCSPCWPASASGRCCSSPSATRSSANRSGWTG
jgi:hypothetical protein